MAEIKIQTTQNVDIRYKLAHIGDRILAALIDVLVLFVYNILVGFFTTALFKLQIYVYIAFLLPVFFYSLLCEVFFDGQSLGKMALNIKVVSLDGSQPTIGQYFLRWIFRLVDIHLSVCSIGVISIIVSEKGQRVGDIVAGTSVIKLTREVSLSHSDLIPARINKEHKISFPQAQYLTSVDVNLIKEVLDAYYYDQNYDVLTSLSEKIRTVYKIETNMLPEKFLKTMLDDHANAVYRDGSFTSWRP